MDQNDDLIKVIESKKYLRPILKELTNPKSYVKNAESYRENTITKFSTNIDHYFYCSEGINDTSWGCAYRSLQTVLYTFLNKKYDIKLKSDNFSLLFLFNSYGSKETLEKIYLKLNKLNIFPDCLKTKNFAPFETQLGWIEPWISHLILFDLGLTSELYYLNEPYGNFIAPDEIVRKNNKLSIVEFKKILLSHFDKENSLPVMIDDGVYSFSIGGCGTTSNENFCIFILDPHIYGEDFGEKGLYTVTLSDDGSPYTELNYKITSNGNKINFKTKSWQILIVERSY